MMNSHGGRDGSRSVPGWTDNPRRLGHADLKRVLNERRDLLERDHVYLTRFGKPLDEAIQEAQPDLDFGTGPGAESCDEGYCWT